MSDAGDNFDEGGLDIIDDFGEDENLELLVVFSTRFECSFASFPLASSVVLYLSHSFRVKFCIFPSRFECSFVSFPLVSSVV